MKKSGKTVKLIPKDEKTMLIISGVLTRLMPLKMKIYSRLILMKAKGKLLMLQLGIIELFPHLHTRTI